jgi:hypothetical protein
MKFLKENSMEPKVEISESLYRELLERDNFLSALEAAGVDNWDGYSVAHEIMDEWNNEHSEENK